MRYSSKMREEELKNKVVQDFFGKFDCTEIIKNIDFAVRSKRAANTMDFRDDYLLWAEAKKASTDIIAMLAQLVLTIGKARTFNDVLPPRFLGCFDCEKIVFAPYAEIQDIFYQNDFNWNAAPSDHESREFRQIYGQLDKIINSDVSWKTYRFDFEKDEKNLKLFILKNFMPGNAEIAKIKIDRNNFLSIYYRWLEAVKPSIEVDWAAAKKYGIIDGDFYLADLLSSENQTLKEKLFVLLKTDYYEADRHIDKKGMYTFSTAKFKDNQKAHSQFWAVYERPPREDYWDYIIERRDLLVPQDVRERKGSFFTPKIWVELSQKYIADVFGENWQDEYYVWDCAAGTGNLLAGLTNKYKIWASTLDKADVDVMHDRIKNGANLLEDQVFQFDFLNDDFSKLPQGLQKIINDEEKRKKLIIYINPPYAEAGTGLGKHKKGVAMENKIHLKYYNCLGKASNELFVQFLTRIFFEMSGCKICEFSTQKGLVAPNFKDFRKFFLTTLKKGFVVPANTFDNVEGGFPIGFKVWDTIAGKHFNKAIFDVYDADGSFLCKKTYRDGPDCKYINDWFRSYFDKKNEAIGILHNNKNDFQHNNQVRITSDDIKDHTTPITQNNLIPASIYFSIRKVILANWLNNRDQFLYPNEKWKTDMEFQNDCLAYTLFNNNISSKHGINHWIPFTEKEVNSRGEFDSNFMTDFIKGKVKFEERENKLFEAKKTARDTPLIFSAEAKAVFDAGRELWRYYHSKPKINVNASFYDIREYFQGRNDKGKMNSKSEDAEYNELIGELRVRQKTLSKKIEPKIYEYGFLRG